MKPEDYRFCKLIEKTVKATDEHLGPDTFVGISCKEL